VRPQSAALRFTRGISAAPFFSSVALVCTLVLSGSAAFADAPASPQASGVAYPPGMTRLSDGLTVVARRATASPAAALEVWIRCPVSGYRAPQPGIGRLAALALLEQKVQGVSLRDEARRVGAQVGVSAYHEGTEIALLVPGYVSAPLLDRLIAQALRPRVDQAAFVAARQRLAAQQVASGEEPDQQLREALFAHVFASGPLHESTYGNARALAGLTLKDVSDFLAHAYVPQHEVVIAVGNIDATDVRESVSRAAPQSAASQTIPASALAPPATAPVYLSHDTGSVAGVALGWIGPPIQDERAATAMDFLSDYLAHPAAGVISKQIAGLDPTSAFSGQFITLRDPGVFMLAVNGERLDPDAMNLTLRQAIKSTLAGPMPSSDFGRAVDAFRTHLLRDMQSPQGIADNYGWYFVQGDSAYSPSSTDASLSGDYFNNVAALTPGYVYDIARRYLSANPAVVLLPKGPVHTAGAKR